MGMQARRLLFFYPKKTFPYLRSPVTTVFAASRSCFSATAPLLIFSISRFKRIRQYTWNRRIDGRYWVARTQGA